MKLCYLSSLLLCCIVSVLFSCTHIDENIRGGVVPPLKIDMAFEALYPNAERPIWRVQNGYYMIEFTYNLLQNFVWLTAQGDFVMQQTVIPETYLPVSVTHAFQASSYANDPLISSDSIVQVEQPTLYRLTVDSSPEKNCLYYSNQGQLMEVIPANQPQLTPPPAVR